MTQLQPRLATALNEEAPEKLRFGEGFLTDEGTVSSPSTLPEGDPELLLRNLARSVFEAIAGTREVEAMSRWLTLEVYSKLLARVQHAARSRQRRGVTVKRQTIEPIRCIWQSPREGVVESTVLVNLGPRVRAVAVRLEAYRGRWRAERLHVL